MTLPFSEMLRRWRAHRELTFKQLAEACGLHVSSLHRMEHGTQEPKHHELVAIAEGFGLSVAEFHDAVPEAPTSDEAA